MNRRSKVMSLLWQAHETSVVALHHADAGDMLKAHAANREVMKHTREAMDLLREEWPIRTMLS